MNIELFKDVKVFLQTFLLGATFFVLNSCTESKVAIELANSFDSTLEGQDSVRLEAKNTDEKLLEKKKPFQSKVSKEIKNSSTKTTLLKKNKFNFNEISNSKKINKRSKSKKEITQLNPQPYRIIIRLSGANPSAPAETVTRALRDAGIIFEVEKIERFEQSSSAKRKLSEGNQF